MTDPEIPNPSCHECGEPEDARTCGNCGRPLCLNCEWPTCVPAWTIWQLTDDMSNGRWLFVDHPGEEGSIPIGINRVYTKYLSSEEARAMAAALIQAADEFDSRPPNPPPTGPVYTTSGTTAVVTPVDQWPVLR